MMGSMAERRQLAFDDPEDAALLAGDEDPTGFCASAAAVSLCRHRVCSIAQPVSVSLGAVDDVAQGVTVVRVIG